MRVVFRLEKGPPRDCHGNNYYYVYSLDIILRGNDTLDLCTGLNSDISDDTHEAIGSETRSTLSSVGLSAAKPMYHQADLKLMST